MSDRPTFNLSDADRIAGLKAELELSYQMTDQMADKLRAKDKHIAALSGYLRQWVGLYRQGSFGDIDMEAEAKWSEQGVEMSGDIIDLKEATRDLKDKLQERLQTEHHHYMDLMKAVIPAANMVGQPFVSVGWMHVVERVDNWRKVMLQQQTILDMALKALAQGMAVSDVQALLNIQRQCLDDALAPWEPVPTITANPEGPP